MNCKVAQGKIVDAMAAHEWGLRGELDQHLRECANCRAFFASQTSLSTAIDSHLRLIADEPGPPSLLPRVRVRLQEEVAPRQWIPRWRLAAVAAVVVLLVAVSIRMGNSDKTDHATESAARVAPGPPNVNQPRTVSVQVQKPAPRTSRVPVVQKARGPVYSSTPDVLILPEEQEAFRRFVSDIAKDRHSANAIISAAPGNGDAPVEIALLTIENVEVNPLEGTDSE